MLTVNDLIIYVTNKDFNNSLITKCTGLLRIQLGFGAFGYISLWQCILVRAFCDWNFSHFCQSFVTVHENSQ